MAECTKNDLRKARNAAGLPRWKLGEKIGESESTIERWETGETQPTPDDVDRFAEAVGDPDLWHRWMLSNCDSYRKRYIGMESMALPMSVMRAGITNEDVAALQRDVERDAIDGKLDDKNLRDKYAQALRKNIAACTDILNKL